MVKQQSQQASFMSLERSKERRQWEVVQVKMTLLHSQRCHENCSDVDYEWMTRLLVVDEVLHINTSFN
ncbi:hypothetical protein KY290_033285 [Solanum tuberosum]|uniref:Uncharacterized protein n=1 Tax=Solanum tuberosum TaxID=4113 RepID=A0ABQ7TZU5_SOLTU|nr:hypothetical protein KY289_032659 [Solanum tuberosum]KAH0647299.1 hypothetical protein KY285_032547 [Solanum tuberosum]KAH0740242.1 hypothetical protein KY290_033285 [Solanum tuberosum]